MTKLGLLLMCLVTIFATGCAQAIDSFSFSRGKIAAPGSYELVTNSDVQGGLSETSRSTTRAIGDQSLGNTNVRTSSASPSFKMVSGIGVQ